MKSYYYYQINNYFFTIASSDNYLIMVKLGKIKLDYKYEETEIIKKTKEELEEYFNHKRTSFDVPVKLEGTIFQKKVWKIMQEIPYGTTICYQELAVLSGSPKAARAIGNVCNKNNILIIIPCHRVTSKHGLGGFGEHINVKINLLELEQHHLNL